VLVFDDVFVDRNVYSGLNVEPEHRQNLHELILGEQGVTLARGVDVLATQIRTLNTELRDRSNAIPAAERQGFNVAEFCALPPLEGIDEQIIEAERRLAALRQANDVRTNTGFAPLALPTVDTPAIETLLARTIADLDVAAAAAVRDHFTGLGHVSESWVASGMNYVPGGVNDVADSPCPFCRQVLGDSQMFAHYRAYFGDAYRQLQVDLVAAQRQLETMMRGDALASFERQVQAAEEKRRFWSAFCQMPSVELDTTAIATSWQAIRDGMSAALGAKRQDPLGYVEIDADTRASVQAYAAVAARVGEASQAFTATNESIDRVKESVQAGNVQAAENELNRLKATKARHSPDIAPLCDAFLQSKSTKEQAEQDKQAAQTALNDHRSAAFPANQSAINNYLARFNAGFMIEQIQPQNTPGRPSCTHQLVINAHRVPVAASTAQPGTPCFKNTMSSGDRNTLALAFFFASIDQDARRANRIVVLDDPISSLDEHRCIATVQEARALASRVAQVIVLSHSKLFLARIWQHTDHASTATLSVTRDGNGSTLAGWNLHEDSVTEYDKRHAQLREYMAANTGNPRGVAQSIRPVLEGYMRVVCPEHFPPGQLLGPFRGIAQQRAEADTPIMAHERLTELGHLVEYANRFHHDTNPAWDVEHINDAELRGFVQRTLAFITV